MRISDLHRRAEGGVVTVSARVTWEDCDRPAEDLIFEVEGVEPERVVASPEAFAIRGALAALQHGERRVLVEGSLCPRLRDGMQTVLRLLRSWWSPGDGSVPFLEASRGFRALSPAPPRAGLFLSGGADSLYCLHSNRMNFPSDHPASLKTAIIVPNFGVRLEAVSAPRAAAFLSRQKNAVARIASLAGLRLVSVWASKGELGENEAFADTCSHSGHLGAAAHLLSPIVDSVTIAPSYDFAHLVPWGSHPLIDVSYTSSAMAIHQTGWGLSREERIATVARWEEALPYLIVCSEGPLETGMLNCGRCEKCLRTMIALLFAGALGEAISFPIREIDAASIQGLALRRELIFFWQSFPEPLRRLGRDDLARVVEDVVARARKKAAWFDDRGWKGAMRRFDRKHLGGRLLDARRRLRGGPAATDRP